MNESRTPHRVVIIGGGFGGLYAANHLRRAGASVTLIDRRNFHLFQPLLYQVATGALSPANIASPLRALLRRQKNAEVLMAEVDRIDVTNRLLHFRDEQPTPLEYDTLIVAAGSQFNYFGHDDWRAVAPGLKSLEDALSIRNQVLKAFELAELETDPHRRRELMTFVVVGGGPTGVELAGAIAEVAYRTLPRDFRRIDTDTAKVILIEATPHILSMFPEELRQKALDQLKNIGVEVRTGVSVTEIAAGHVTTKVGETEEQLRAETILWTAGVKASSLGESLAQGSGQSVDRAGRVPVEADCSLPGHPEVFVIGDLASFTHGVEGPLPALAPVAMQQGRYVADLVRRRLEGRDAPPPFHYHDKGTLATIGRSAAVADLGWIKLSGFIAWITWLFVHILYLVQFQNRLLVLFQWAYSFLTRGRAARLITGESGRGKES